MKLSKNQNRHLRSLAHELKPVVMIGQHGLKETIFEEMEVALNSHELIKVKVNAGDKAERDEMIEKLIKKSGSDLIQKIGSVAVFFKRNTDEPKIALPHK